LEIQSTEFEKLGWLRLGVVFIKESVAVAVIDGAKDQKLEILKAEVLDGRVILESISSLEEFLVERNVIEAGKKDFLLRYESRRRSKRALELGSDLLRNYLRDFISE
jgi:hypothetical protein